MQSFLVKHVCTLGAEVHGGTWASAPWWPMHWQST